MQDDLKCVYDIFSNSSFQIANIPFQRTSNLLFLTYFRYEVSLLYNNTFVIYKLGTTYLGHKSIVFLLIHPDKLEYLY